MKINWELIHGRALEAAADDHRGIGAVEMPVNLPDCKAARRLNREAGRYGLRLVEWEGRVLAVALPGELA